MIVSAALDTVFAAKLLASPAEVAALLDIDAKTLRALVRRGELSFRIVGTGEARPRRKFGRDDVEAYLERAQCRSIDPAILTERLSRRTTTTTSSVAVIDFQDRQALLNAVKQNASNGRGATKPRPR